LDDLEHELTESNAEYDNTIWPLLVLKVPLVLYVTLSTIHMSVVCLDIDDILHFIVALPLAFKSDGGGLISSLGRLNVEQSKEEKLLKEAVQWMGCWLQVCYIVVAEDSGAGKGKKSLPGYDTSGVGAIVIALIYAWYMLWIWCVNMCLKWDY